MKAPAGASLKVLEAVRRPVSRQSRKGPVGWQGLELSVQ